MRGVRLGQIAARAELLRLRCLARRQAIRAVLAFAAGVFLLGAVAWLHVAGAIALSDRFTPAQSALIVAGIDVVIAIVLALFAVRDVPGKVEREALRVRRVATEQAIETVALAALLGSLRRVRSFRGLVNVAIAAVLAIFVGTRR